VAGAIKDRTELVIAPAPVRDLWKKAKPGAWAHEATLSFGRLWPGFAEHGTN
jgi:hypothetical protein